MTLHLRGTLVTRGALAISTGHPDVRSDQPVLTDQRGLPIIPGSTLAGALRAAALRALGAATVEVLMGPSTIRGEDRAAERSRVTVQDAILIDPLMAPPRQLRQHVGIDREHLTARDGAKFDRETWPLGLPFRLALDLDDHSLLDELMVAIVELSGPLGGVGAGRCRVEIDIEQLEVHGDAAPSAMRAAAEHRWEHPDEPAPRGERLQWSPAPSPEQSGDSEGRRTAAVDLHLVLRTLTPLLVREPVSPFAQAEDNVPFGVHVVERVEGDSRGSWRVVRRPAIPGESLLGVLRQRAERALAHAGLPGGDPFVKPGTDGRDAAHPVLRTFGMVGTAEEAASGAIRVEDAVLWGRDGRDDFWRDETRVVYPSDAHSSGRDGRDGLWEDETAAGEQKWAVVRPRVHIDRLTSAPLGSGKFEDTAVADGRDLHVMITVAPQGRPFEDSDFALVAIGLRDLLAGAAGVGGSVRSGYGSLGLVRASLVEHVRYGDKGSIDSLPAVGLGSAAEGTVLDALSWDEVWTARLERGWQRITDPASTMGGGGP